MLRPARFPSLDSDVAKGYGGIPIYVWYVWDQNLEFILRMYKYVENLYME